MTLRALLPGIAQRYAFAGLALGSLLPTIGLIAELLLYRGRLTELRLDDPFLVLAFALPFLSSAVFFRFGRINEKLLIRLSAGEVIERELLHLSLHDRLTGLPNRASLEREIERFATARRKGRSRPAFLLLDLDKFKHVNDTLGHDAGDELLQLFSIRITALVGPQARIFRLGGDEFVVTVAGSPSDMDLERLCRSIQMRAAEPFELRAGRAVIGVSIGIAYFETEDFSLPDVMKRADLALYAAKDIAGSAHVFHDRVLANDMQERMRTEQEIASGLLREEFFVEYQPVVSVETRQVAAFEALARWHHPTLGFIAPPEIVLAAHAVHQSDKLTGAIADACCRLLHDLPGLGLPEATVAVNVSPREFALYSVADLLDATVARHGIDPALLEVEITEEALLDTVIAGEQLKRLEQSGFALAVDDFGAGHSSLTRLIDLKVDRLKIDRGIITQIAGSERNQAIVSALIRLGDALSMKLLAEGVETEADAEALRRLHCQQGQGYLFARPMPIGRIPGWIAERREKERRTRLSA